jgi:serine/threonine-protein kinase
MPSKRDNSKDSADITEVFDTPGFADLMESTGPDTPTARIDTSGFAPVLREPAARDSAAEGKAESEGPDRPGKVIAGKYTLTKVAGKGGMATVWQAISRGVAGFERPVALKRIRPDLIRDREFVSMFVEEARVGSKIQHPHVVQIIDFGLDDDGAYFLVMEWIDGLDLASYLRSYHAINRTAPWSVVVSIVLECLRGLGAAHERPEGAVIHRDICPQNILVGFDGIAKLTDFGLSRAVDRMAMTRPDIVKGKVAYLAPELTYGKQPTVRSDLYGVGIVLWESLTGQRLFHGESDVEVLLEARTSKIPAVSYFRPDLPAELSGIIHTALSKDPGLRFSDSHQMARALAHVLRTSSPDTDAHTVATCVRDAKARLQ